MTRGLIDGVAETFLLFSVLCPIVLVPGAGRGGGGLVQKVATLGAMEDGIGWKPCCSDWPSEG